MIECLHCGKWWVQELLKRWHDGVAFWFHENASTINPNLYCPSCAPVPRRERCTQCALHWPEDLIWKRICPVCRKRIRQSSYPAMTEARFSKLYKET